MSVSIFDFEDYKAYIHQRIEEMPNRGRGEWARIAKALRLHPTRVSQIFKGEIQLSPEQACTLTNFLGLSAIESEYFMVLVQLGRAGSHDLEQMLKRQIQKIRDQAKQLVNRISREKVLSGEQSAIFYSSWAYSGIRLATSTEQGSSVDKLAIAFGMSREKIRAIIDFLLESGLCVEKDGRLVMGAKTTHLDKTSPLALQHHSNWRLKGLSRHQNLTDLEMAYTCPVSLREKDMIVVREILIQTIQKFLGVVTESDPPDTLACLNIDWFKFIAS